MFAIIGLVVLLGMVFGGFIFTGGDIGPVLHALPHEMLIIGGAAVGALIIGNSGADLKALGGGLAKVFKGPAYKKQDFLDCIFLVSKLMKTLRVEGPVALEPHIEDPASSTIFSEYPKLMKDKTLIHLISDTLRLVVVSSGTLDPHAVEEVMDNSLKTHHHEAIKPADNLQGLADALPALGLARIAPPDGAFYIYADISHLTNDSLGFCQRLLRETGVATAPGIDFDPVDGHRFIRFSFAVSTDRVEDAIARMVPWFQAQPRR